MRIKNKNQNKKKKNNTKDFNNIILKKNVMKAFQRMIQEVNKKQEEMIKLRKSLLKR